MDADFADVTMTLSLKKIGGIAFGTGFAIALLLATVNLGLAKMNLHPGAWLSTVYTILWPTGIMLFEADANLAGYTVLIISLICNGIIYAFGAVLIVYYVKLAKNRGYDFRDDD
jgi:hypothetical protein